MIIVDRALEQRAEAGNPIRVGMVGAGFMAHGIANQIVNSTPGMELVAIANRTPSRADDAYQQAGVDAIKHAGSAAEIDRAVADGYVAVTDDPLALSEADAVEAIIEVTGAIEYGAHAVTHAFEQGKHAILMNAELDGTVGWVLRQMAEQAGVVYTVSDGDQPGVQMNLYRFVRQLGLQPLVCGNIKGLHDPYRNPTTQEGFARQWGQNPWMVTSFADGTKISYEQAVVANATGMTVARRGMYGRDLEGHVDEGTALFDLEELTKLGGIVDYFVKAKPGPGVFVYATHDDPKQRHYLNLYKLGEGPLYSFYAPYHLCHFEVPITVARAVLFSDAALQPAGPLRVEVVAAAKTDLAEGTVLDGLGGYHTYGLAETASLTDQERLLPIGVAEGCRLRNRIPKDTLLRYENVQLPPGRLCDELRKAAPARTTR